MTDQEDNIIIYNNNIIIQVKSKFLTIQIEDTAKNVICKTVHTT